MNQEEISLELLSIIISDIPKRQQTKTIKYLIDSNILNSKENNLCEKLLENMQYYGDIRVEQTLYKINCEIDFKDIPVINKTSDVFEHIEKFIESRREEQNKIIIEKALESSTSETFNKEIRNCEKTEETKKISDTKEQKVYKRENKLKNNKKIITVIGYNGVRKDNIYFNFIKIIKKSKNSNN